MPLAIVHWPLQRQPQGGPVKGPLGSREAAAYAQQKKDMPRFISQIICMVSKFCVGNKENETV